MRMNCHWLPRGSILEGIGEGFEEAHTTIICTPTLFINAIGDNRTNPEWEFRNGALKKLFRRHLPVSGQIRHRLDCDNHLESIAPINPKKALIMIMKRIF